MKLRVLVCDVVTIVYVCNEGGDSEKVPAEIVSGKVWSEFCKCEYFQVSYERE